MTVDCTAVEGLNCSCPSAYIVINPSKDSDHGNKDFSHAVSNWESLTEPAMARWQQNMLPFPWHLVLEVHIGQANGEADLSLAAFSGWKKSIALLICASMITAHPATWSPPWLLFYYIVDFVYINLDGSWGSE